MSVPVRSPCRARMLLRQRSVNGCQRDKKSDICRCCAGDRTEVEITLLESHYMESTLCAESCRTWVNSFILLLLYYISISSSVYFCHHSAVSECHGNSACRIGAELHRSEHGFDHLCRLDTAAATLREIKIGEEVISCLVRGPRPGHRARTRHSR